MKQAVKTNKVITLLFFLEMKNKNNYHQMSKGTI